MLWQMMVAKCCTQADSWRQAGMDEDTKKGCQIPTAQQKTTDWLTDWLLSALSCRLEGGTMDEEWAYGDEDKEKDSVSEDINL